MLEQMPLMVAGAKTSNNPLEVYASYGGKTDADESSISLGFDMVSELSWFLPPWIRLCGATITEHLSSSAPR